MTHVLADVIKLLHGNVLWFLSHFLGPIGWSKIILLLVILLLLLVILLLLKPSPKIYVVNVKKDIIIWLIIWLHGSFFVAGKTSLDTLWACNAGSCRLIASGSWINVKQLLYFSRIIVRARLAVIVLASLRRGNVTRTRCHLQIIFKLFDWVITYSVRLIAFCFIVRFLRRHMVFSHGGCVAYLFFTRFAA